MKKDSNSEHSEIRELPAGVIDQIAAGEVVERPAHLVKELLENAVDAFADQIEISVDLGGRSVHIVDNGIGIRKEQMRLALTRHATSKIRETADLWKLGSFGFRGEALASIAAVSQLTMNSKFQDSNEAFRIISNFGELTDVESVGGRQGTDIRIENLFENVPARLKFLRSDGGEVAQIKQAVKAMALSHPEVSFKLRVKGKLVWFWPKTEDPLKRTEDVLGINPLYKTSGSYEGMKSEIFFAAPNQTFGNSKNIWIFVQRRWIQDRSLQAAVMEAYRGLLMHGEFPYIVVWLDCEPDRLDVNIHPTKSQVKFDDPKVAFRAINRVLRESVEKAPWLEDVISSSFQEGKDKPMSQEVEQSLTFSDPSLQKTQYAQKDFQQTVRSAVEGYVVKGQQQEKRYNQANYSHSYKVKDNQDGQVNQSSGASVPSTHSGESTVAKKWSDLEVIGQAHLTYIVTQADDKLIFVDQHAAHERVVYERLMNRMVKGENGTEEGRMDVQSFLLPISVDLEEEAVAALMELKSDILKLGIEIEQAGPESLVVCSAPSILKDHAIVQSIHKLSQDVLKQGDSFAIEQSIAEVCATMACHSVVRAGMSMSKEEMRTLLAEMDEFPLSSFCPHGRPVYVEYPFTKLERDFGRLG